MCTAYCSLKFLKKRFLNNIQKPAMKFLFSFSDILRSFL